MFVYDVITFQLLMNEFKEDAFSNPLQSNGLIINLNPGK